MTDNEADRRFYRNMAAFHLFVAAARDVARDVAKVATWDAARATAWDAAWDAMWGEVWDAARVEQATFLRDIFGNPWRTVTSLYNRVPSRWGGRVRVSQPLSHPHRPCRRPCRLRRAAGSGVCEM